MTVTWSDHTVQTHRHFRYRYSSSLSQLSVKTKRKWWIPAAEMLRGQSSHKNLVIEFSVWPRSWPATDSRMWTEAKHSPWAIISPDKFSLLLARDTNRADLASQSQTHSYLAEWVIVTGGGWLFSILPVHSWESSLPTANYVITVIWNILSHDSPHETYTPDKKDHFIIIIRTIVIIAAANDIQIFHGGLKIIFKGFCIINFSRVYPASHLKSAGTGPPWPWA